MGEIAITAEDIRAAIPLCGKVISKPVAKYVMARLNGMRPIDAMDAAGRDNQAVTRYERWYEVFCESTGRPYEPWVSPFDKRDNQSFHSRLIPPTPKGTWAAE